MPLSIAIANTRAGQPVAKQYAEPILALCLQHSSFATLAEHCGTGEARLIAKRVKLGPRTMKAICFAYKGSIVPITKAKLMSRPRTRPCKHCKAMQCHRNTNLAKMREAIAEQIVAHKQKVRDELVALGNKQERSAADLSRIRELTHCPLTGKRLLAGEVHVDHAFPFSKLIVAWLEQNEGITLCETKLWLKRNAQLMTSWAEYHRANAVLQLVNGKANLSKGAKC